MKQIYFSIGFLLILSLLNGCSDLQTRAASGDANAEYEYAFYLQTEKRDYASARHWYELSAKHGNQWAKNNLNLPPFAPATTVQTEPVIAKSNTSSSKPHEQESGMSSDTKGLIALGLLAAGAYAIFGGSSDTESDTESECEAKVNSCMARLSLNEKLYAPPWNSAESQCKKQVCN